MIVTTWRSRFLALTFAALSATGTESAVTIANQGTTLYATGNYAGAAEAYSRAIEMWESQGETRTDAYAFVLHNAAICHKMLGEYRMSEVRTLKALDVVEQLHGEASAQSAAMLRNLLDLYGAQARKQEQKALIEVARRANADEAKRDGLAEWQKARFTAVVELAAGKPLEAVRALERSAREVPESVKARYLGELANAQLQSGLFNQAEKSARMALGQLKGNEQGPAYISAMNNLAQAKRLQGKTPGLQREYSRALDACTSYFSASHPDCGRILRNFAELNQSIGNEGAARKQYERASQIARAAQEFPVVERRADVGQ